MSHTFYVQGYVDVRVFIDDDVHTTQSASGDDIAELITMNVQNRIGQCQLIGHALVIEGLQKEGK